MRHLLREKVTIPNKIPNNLLKGYAAELTQISCAYFVILNGYIPLLKVHKSLPKVRKVGDSPQKIRDIKDVYLLVD